MRDPQRILLGDKVHIHTDKCPTPCFQRKGLDSLIVLTAVVIIVAALLVAIACDAHAWSAAPDGSYVSGDSWEATPDGKYVSAE